MKKLIFLIAIGLLAIMSVQAQQVNIHVITNDTLTDADTITSSTVVPSRLYYGSIHVVADSLSGAPNGSAVLQESLDGTNWIDVSGKTLTINGSGTIDAIWSLTPFTARYYRIYVLGAGTASIKMNAYVTLYYTNY